MTFRKITFGSIGLLNNGFDISQYRPAFHPNNFSELNEHPRNWHFGKVKDDAEYFCDNDPRLKQSLEEYGRTKISSSEIEEINRKFENDYQTAKEGYAKSKGFLSDFSEAMAYSERQVRMGFNSTSGLIHPMAIVQCEEKATIRSSLGREYIISAHIWINGEEHEKLLCLDLYPTEEMANSNHKRFAQFIMEHNWKERGLLLDPMICSVLQGGEERKETLWYDIKDPILEVHVQAIDMSLGAFAINGNPGNYESFCHKLIDEFDEFYG